jgi:hypothetical protein
MYTYRRDLFWAIINHNAVQSSKLDFGQHSSQKFVLQLLLAKNNCQKEESIAMDRG